MSTEWYSGKPEKFRFGPAMQTKEPKIAPGYWLCQIGNVVNKYATTDQMVRFLLSNPGCNVRWIET